MDININAAADIFFDSIADSAIDSVRLLPFLFVTYLVMEYLEHKTGSRTAELIRKAGKTGPVWGGVLGIFPQCGFSAAASSLYAGRLITVGTLLAVYLSTSDEMLPILLSEQIAPGLILKILGLKMIIGIITGLAVDWVWTKVSGKSPNSREDMDIHSICEQENCHCGEGSIFRSACSHTFHIVIYIFLISLVLNIVITGIGEENLSGFILDVPIVGQMIAALVGLIPNCAASVVITQLYIEGVLNGGAMMSGLLVGAGVGILVLFRLQKNLKKNLQIVVLLYGTGVLWGLLIQLVGIL